jgi:hypothetical protein
MFPECGDTRVHLRLRRVAVHAREGACGEAGKEGAKFSEQGQRREAAVGDDERACKSLLQQVLADEAPRACTEMDRRGEGESGKGHGKDGSMGPSEWRLIGRKARPALP